MYDIVLSLITAFVLTYFAIPSIVNIARIKRLMDEPGERRSHTISTPSLGGIAIFAGMLFSIILWIPSSLLGDLQYILCAFLLIFLVGAKDDILPIAPVKKLIVQTLAAFILVYKSGVEITNLHGIFGIYELPIFVSLPLSIFTIIVIVNAFNLIDGINGLSGSLGILIAGTFGSWFYLTGNLSLAIVSFSMIGAIMAFLKYNFTPAKIFMGDTGSLLLGLVIAVLALKFMETNQLILENPEAFFTVQEYSVSSIAAITFGILIVPLYDTLRVFSMRIYHKRSPFSPDRTHIHHLLLDAGNNHLQATGILVLVNIGFIFLSFQLQSIGNLYLLGVLFSLATILSFGLYFYVQNQQTNEKTKKTPIHQAS